MTSTLLDRAIAWTAKSTPSQEELLTAHNNLALRVMRGAESIADADPALEHLGEAYVEAGGDPLELLALDVDVPSSATQHTCSVAADTSSLVDYSEAPPQLTLDPVAKRQAFDSLRTQLGRRNVSHV